MKLRLSGQEEVSSFITSFDDSELRKQYFPQKAALIETFNEFQEKKSLFTAEQNNQTIGYISYLPKGAFHSFPYIHTFTILPEFRNRGYGSRMLRTFEEDIIKGASKVFLVVADFNPAAKAFYEKSGYRQVGTIPGLYRLGITENLMMKEK